MPKKNDPELKARAVRLVDEHAGEYQNLTAASVAVAKRLGVILRQYFPKGTDLSRWSAEEIEAVAHALNTRPRKTLGRKVIDVTARSGLRQGLPDNPLTFELDEGASHRERRPVRGEHVSRAGSEGAS